MPWNDFRGFVMELERRGESRLVEGAHCDLEIGTLVELMCEREGPMLLFDRIVGFPEGYRIAAKPYATPNRCAIAAGLPEGVSPLEMFKVWRARMNGFRPVQPEQVPGGPVLENVLEGDAVDLTRFPIPKWHEKDGGPYFGTGCAVITRDPDDGWVNLGTYRCMFHDEKTTGLDIAPYRHGNLHLRKWWSTGKACPVAIAIGMEPTLFLASTETLPWGTSEYEFAGYMKGEPLCVFQGPHTGLPLPANAELIVEGEVPLPSEDQRLEGPFGEYTGYYAGGEKLRPVVRVQAIYHRSEPILHGDPPLKPPVLNVACPPSRVMLSVWDGLERVGLPGIKGVYSLSTGSALTTVVSVKQHYAGHARQVGRAASGMINGTCRLLIVVDDDIDPSNPQEVLWAIATRSDPATMFEIQEQAPSNVLDPIMRPEKKKGKDWTNSRAMIIACRPWEWMDEFPEVNRASDELRKQTYERWPHLFRGGI
jgi:4-hydroxy-3-polyprenylbenzoate decarboxylase